MAANSTATTVRKQAAIPPVAIVVGIVLLAGLAGFWYLSRPAKPAPLPPLTGPAKEYVKYLKFVSADGAAPESPKMAAHESYLKQSVVEITGNIKNTGDRVLNLVEIYWEFKAPALYMQDGSTREEIVLRERVPIVTKKMGGLAPGETKPFRVAFDNVPDDWNQALPTMVIAAIEF